jgi:hypothetical protein
MLEVIILVGCITAGARRDRRPPTAAPELSTPPAIFLSEDFDQ